MKQLLWLGHIWELLPQVSSWVSLKRLDHHACLPERYGGSWLKSTPSAALHPPLSLFSHHLPHLSSCFQPTARQLLGFRQHLPSQPRYPDAWKIKGSPPYPAVGGRFVKCSSFFHVNIFFKTKPAEEEEEEEKQVTIGTWAK